MRYTDAQLVEIQTKTTANPSDNAGVVLPLVWDLQDARKQLADLRQLLVSADSAISLIFYRRGSVVRDLGDDFYRNVDQLISKLRSASNLPQLSTDSGENPKNIGK